LLPVICGLEGLKYQIPVIPSQNEKPFDIHNTVEDFLSFFLLLDSNLSPGVEKPWRNKIFRLASSPIQTKQQAALI